MLASMRFVGKVRTNCVKRERNGKIGVAPEQGASEGLTHIYRRTVEWPEAGGAEQGWNVEFIAS